MLKLCVCIQYIYVQYILYICIADILQISYIRKRQIVRLTLGCMCCADAPKLQVQK